MITGYFFKANPTFAKSIQLALTSLQKSIKALFKSILSEISNPPLFNFLQANLYSNIICS